MAISLADKTKSISSINEIVVVQLQQQASKNKQKEKKLFCYNFFFAARQIGY